MGNDGNVKKFLHKQTAKILQQQGAVNQHDAVDIDTGMVIFSTEMLHSLYSMISNKGTFDESKYKVYVNDKVRLSLYGDFLYPLASDSTLEAFYKEKPEGEYCQELTEARKVVCVKENYSNRRRRKHPCKQHYLSWPPVSDLDSVVELNS